MEIRAGSLVFQVCDDDVNDIRHYGIRHMTPEERLEGIMARWGGSCGGDFKFDILEQLRGAAAQGRMQGRREAKRANGLA